MTCPLAAASAAGQLTLWRRLSARPSRRSCTFWTLSAYWEVCGLQCGLCPLCLFGAGNALSRVRGNCQSKEQQSLRFLKGTVCTLSACVPGSLKSGSTGCLWRASCADSESDQWPGR